MWRSQSAACRADSATTLRTHSRCRYRKTAACFAGRVHLAWPGAESGTAKSDRRRSGKRMTCPAARCRENLGASWSCFLRASVCCCVLRLVPGPALAQEQFVQGVLAFVPMTVTEIVEEGAEGFHFFLRHLQSDQDAADVAALIPIVEQADVPVRIHVAQKAH